MKVKFIRERLETRINFFDPIKISKLKTSESANKKVMVKTSFPRTPLPLGTGTRNGMLLKTNKAKGCAVYLKISYHLKSHLRILH